MTVADLRIGIQLPTRELAATGEFSIAPLLELARQAEALGFDSAWVGDSLLARPRLDPLVVLAAVSAVTSRITLGTAALTAALRHPLIGASMLSSLDQSSGGRLIIGVGSGFPVPESAAEFGAVGVPFQTRISRLDETVALWRCAWQSGSPSFSASFTGRVWQADGLDRLIPPRQPGGPPLWLAASDTPRVLARVARCYDGWLPFLPTAVAYDAAWRRLNELAAGRGQAQGGIVPGLYATVSVDADRRRAEEGLERYVQAYYGRSLEVMRTVQAYGWGEAGRCVEWLTGYVRAGARHLVVRIGSLEARAQLAELAETVVPAVRAAYREMVSHQEVVP
jgi:alkanesulfonate monooxygenase SsuD/methylene tetrahydromethanopterin reductase-like flavin-dependent oxidoreductase (luciferase family)